MVVYLRCVGSVKDVLSLLECLDHCKLCMHWEYMMRVELAAWR